MEALTLKTAVRALVLAAILEGTSLVFMEKMVLSALILVTVALAAAAFVVRRDPAGPADAE